jgi:hypothetical protein
MPSLNACTVFFEGRLDRLQGKKFKNATHGTGTNACPALYLSFAALPAHNTPSEGQSGAKKGKQKKNVERMHKTGTQYLLFLLALATLGRSARANRANDGVATFAWLLLPRATSVVAR